MSLADAKTTYLASPAVGADNWSQLHELAEQDFTAGYRAGVRAGRGKRPTREAIRRAVGAVLANASNFPERVQSRLLGEDLAPLIDKVTDAVLADVTKKVGE